MDNNELLEKISSMMQQQNDNIRSDMAAMMQQQNQELRTEMQQQNQELRTEMQQQNQELRTEMQQQNQELRTEMQQQRQEIVSDVASVMEQQTKFMMDEINSLKITIENDVTMRIETLFDGYKLTHDKQWELERRVQNIEKKLGMVV